jgi:hypothetical protein
MAPCGRHGFLYRLHSGQAGCSSAHPDRKVLREDASTTTQAPVAVASAPPARRFRHPREAIERARGTV